MQRNPFPRTSMMQKKLTRLPLCRRKMQKVQRVSAAFRNLMATHIGKIQIFLPASARETPTARRVSVAFARSETRGARIVGTHAQLHRRLPHQLRHCANGLWWAQERRVARTGVVCRTRNSLGALVLVRLCAKPWLKLTPIAESTCGVMARHAVAS
jgi:hypothetical protein